MPLQLQKHNIINSLHLLELEELFKEISYLSSWDPNCDTYFDAALKVCPDILLHDSDEYMASLINRLSIEKKNIFVICGYGQSRTIPYHLYHNPRVFSDEALNKVIRYNKPFETLLR